MWGMSQDSGGVRSGVKITFGFSMTFVFCYPCADPSVAVQQLQQTVDALSQGKAAADQELEQARQKLKEETDAKLKATELAEALQRKVAQQDVDFERMKSELRTLQASKAEAPKDVNTLDFSEAKAAGTCMDWAFVVSLGERVMGA